MNKTPGLVIKDLCKTYRNGVSAMNNVDLNVKPGMFGLLGPNGAGKSTLMRTLATLQSPDRGEIFLDGVDVLHDPDYLRRRLGYMPQTLGAYPGVSARNLLSRFAWLKGQTDRRQRETEVESLLERVNLSHAANQTVATYSGGMLRRFGIAIALIGSPRLLIVDEPTAGLDPAEANRFHRVLADVATEAIVLLSTHIVEDIESLCDRLTIMAQGQILVEGSPEELIAPLKDQLWTRVIPRGETIPEAFNLRAAPRGTRVIMRGERPDDQYEPHPPTLEDAYYSWLSKVGLGEAA